MTRHLCWPPLSAHLARELRQQLALALIVPQVSGLES